MGENGFELSSVAPTGVAGLDDVLAGGLSRGHVFLLEGEPGSGKTTIALQFLRHAAAAGERTLYITLSETARELREGAKSHGWTLDESIRVVELTPEESLNAAKQQSLLYSSDLELGETAQKIFSAVEEANPHCVVIDSLSEIRLLAQSSLRYRRQILALKHYFARREATVLLLDDLTTDTLDKTVHSVVHGVIRLEQLSPDYGAERRRLRVLKYRGQHYRGGYHDFTIKTGGVNVFPRLVALEHHSNFARTQLKSGIPALDGLLGGGVESGSSALLVGPSGTGKSLIAFLFAVAAVKRGERAAVFVFDGGLNPLQERCRQLGLDLDELRRSGSLLLEQVDAAELSPGEFIHKVRWAVDEHQIKTVVIDSLNGFQVAMPQEKALNLHLNELLQYLNRQGATTFLTIAQHGVVGTMNDQTDITYLGDAVIMLRFFEAFGEVRRAISVLKKRLGGHETTIRELRIDGSGLTIGEPLSGFQGVLSGTPLFTGTGGELLGNADR